MEGDSQTTLLCLPAELRQAWVSTRHNSNEKAVICCLLLELTQKKCCSLFVFYQKTCAVTQLLYLFGLGTWAARLGS